MGALLAFRNPLLESAFERRFHERRLPLDRLYLATVVGCNLAVVLLKLLPDGRWGTAAMPLAEAAATAGLLAWRRVGTASYLRHRARLLACLYTTHALVRRAAGQGACVPCRGAPADVMLARHLLSPPGRPNCPPAAAPRLAGFSPHAAHEPHTHLRPGCS